MNVASILGQKGRDVVSVSKDTTLLDVTRTLSDHKIGAIVVTDNDKLAGIISERDIIKAVSARGPDCLRQPTEAAMTKDVVCCRMNDTIDHLMGLMTQGRFRHLPVVDSEDHIIGVISIGDVVKNHIAEVEMEASALKSYLTSG